MWRVVRRDGITATSVRGVAAEAGTSPSALRHYFTTQDELLGFALRTLIERVASRLAPELPGLEGRDGALRILGEVLPMDEERRAEVEVYLAFVARSTTDPALRAVRDDVDEATRAAVAYALQLLERAGELGAGRSAAAEADRTYPLVDGLAVHGTLWPERYPPAHLRRVLEHHLDELSTALSS
nr:TetR family transcriptional regulator C-terminal domain-containing protein [Motilibacter deserti]